MAELSYTQVKKTEWNSKKFHLTFLADNFIPTLGVLEDLSGSFRRNCKVLLLRLDLYTHSVTAFLIRNFIAFVKDL